MDLILFSASRRVVPVLAVLSILLITGCGGGAGAVVGPYNASDSSSSGGSSPPPDGSGGSGGGGSGSPPPPQGSGTATLSWVAPTTNTDGSPVTLSAFNIYSGTSSTSLAMIASVGSGVTQYAVNGLAAGRTYYYAVTAVSTTGQESDYSNIGSKTIN
jgi:hypothetical protein